MTRRGGHGLTHKFKPGEAERSKQYLSKPFRDSSSTASVDLRGVDFAEAFLMASSHIMKNKVLHVVRFLRFSAHIIPCLLSAKGGQGQILMGAEGHWRL